MSEPHFTEEHRAQLSKIFADLADFMHSNHIEQVVGAGASATPYTRAVIRAYNNRYGSRARKVSLVNLGPVENRIIYEMGKVSPGMWANNEGDAVKFLMEKRRKFEPGKKTLLFDEMVHTGNTLRDLTHLFNRMSVPHKTAVLLRVKSDYPSMFDGFSFRPDFMGGEIFDNESLHEKVFVRRRISLDPERNRANRVVPFRTVQKLRKMKAELREIAESVPKAHE